MAHHGGLGPLRLKDEEVDTWDLAVNAEGKAQSDRLQGFSVYGQERRSREREISFKK